MNIVMVNPQELKYYERNNKKHPPEQIKQIMNSITEFGFVDPVILDKIVSVIIAGHGRAEAAKALSLKEIPALYLNDLTKEQINALRIAHNKIASNATWDNEALKFELEQLQLEDFNLDVLGFELEDIERLLMPTVADEPTPPVSLTPKPSKIMIECHKDMADSLCAAINKLIKDKRYIDTSVKLLP